MRQGFDVAPWTTFSEEDAVSPIVAVVLLVAITIVAGATVFFLLSGLGGEADEGTPRLQFVTSSSTTTGVWVLKVAGATRAVHLGAYEVVHTTPAAGVIVYSIGDDSAFTGTDHQEILSGDMTGKDDSVLTAADGTTTKLDVQPGYRLQIQDTSGDDLFGVIDTIRLSYDGPDADGLYTQALPTGVHKLELRHVPTAGMSAAVSNAF